VQPLPAREPGISRLSAHHLHALAVAVLIDRYLKVDPTHERLADLAGKVAGFAEKELFPHFQVEETALFPTLREVLDSDALLDELIAHHRKMEELVHQLADSSDPERASLLRQFGSALRRHIRMEEVELFRQIGGSLDAAGREELGRRVDEAAREMGLTVHRLW
jgi:hemerythrin-like domain-containing protein